MGRILAIDYGSKRTGLAVTDELQLIASGLTTVPTASLMPYLKTYSKEENVEAIVIGEPKRLSGEASAIEASIQHLIAGLKTALPDIKIIRQDERFTSKMAFQTMIDSGISKKKRRDKALVDQISATIILQEYLYNK